MSDLPKIQVSFFFSGDEFDITDVTGQMQLAPTSTRDKNSFPIEEFAQTEWTLETAKESSKVVSWQFEKLLQLLNGKEEAITRICNRYGISAGFCVTIWMESGNNPVMLLTREIIGFLASISAEVGFDIYAY